MPALFTVLKSPWSIRLGKLLFPALLLAFVSVAAGCGTLNPLNENSIWRTPQGIAGYALKHGDAVILMHSPGYTVWQKTDAPDTTFHSSKWERKTFGDYVLIPVEPGEYALADGYQRLFNRVVDTNSKEVISSGLGRVELTRRDITEDYQYEAYVSAQGEWRTDKNGFRQYVETIPWHYETRTGTRVVGHYLAGYIKTRPTTPDGAPRWAGFRIAPGEIILLQSAFFSGVEPDYNLCSSTSVLFDSWSCPITEMRFILEPDPGLEECRSAAVEAGFPAELAERIILRPLTPGTMLHGQNAQPVTAGTRYIFTDVPAASGNSTKPAPAQKTQ